jgi:hypothetical protein
MFICLQKEDEEAEMDMFKRLLESKRGESASTESAPEYVLYFMAGTVIVGLFAVFLVIATSSYQSSTTTVIGNLKYTIVQYRLMHSAECFAYQDPGTKRVYTMMIDLDKFTDEQMEKCMKGLETNSLCLDLELKETNGKTIGEISTINYVFPDNVAVDEWVINIFDQGKIRTAMLTINQGDPC